MDKRRIYEEAQRFEKRGQIDKAISLLAEIVSHDPNEIKALSDIIRLYQRKGDKEKSIEYHIILAQRYMKSGFQSKALGVLKNALSLDKRNIDIYLNLIEVYRKMNYKGELANTLKEVIILLEEEGRKAEQKEFLLQLLELEPENLSAMVKLAELYAGEGKHEEAEKLFSRTENILKAEGKFKQLAILLERKISSGMGSEETEENLAECYISSGEFGKAGKILQRLLSEKKVTERRLILLIRALEGLGKTDKVLPVLKQLLSLYMKREDVERSKEIAKKILQYEPENEMAKKVLLMEKRPAERKVEAKTTAKIKEIIETESQDPLKLINFLLVFVKYSNIKQAREYLKKVLEQDYELEVLMNVAKQCVKYKFKEGAEEIFLKAIEKARETGREQEIIDEALKYFPDSEKIRSAAGIEEEIEIESSHEEEINQMNISADQLEKEISQKEESVELELAPEHEEEEVSLESLTGEEEKEEEVPLESLTGKKEEKEVLQGFEAEKKGEEEIVTEEDIREAFRTDEDISFEREFEEKEAVEKEIPDESIMLDDELNEAEFYISQGLYKEAREILMKTIEKKPHSTRAQELLKSLDDIEKTKGEMHLDENNILVSEGKAMGDFSDAILEGDWDLKEVLDEELEEKYDETQKSLEPAHQVSAEEVLKEFKKGVKKIIGEEECQAHYDLAHAYMDMGLYNEAIEEFMLSMKSDELKVPSLLMIGLCYINQSKPSSAIEVLEKAWSEAKDEEKIDIEYNMGVAWEMMSMPEKAIEWLQKVAERNSSFKDVAQRIEVLKSMLKPRKKEEGFERLSLEDILGEEYEETKAEITSKIPVKDEMEVKEQKGKLEGEEFMTSLKEEGLIETESPKKEERKEGKKKITFI